MQSVLYLSLIHIFTTKIPHNEKAGVYEDNQEIHYRKINPNKKCVEFFVDDKITYPDIIKAGLRHNIDWILLSESRGPEVAHLLNSLSTGSYCMTTMHLDDVRDTPDRMYNMLGSSNINERFINSIYKYLSLIHISFLYLRKIHAILAYILLMCNKCVSHLLQKV